MTLPRIARVECDGFDFGVFATGDFISQAIIKDGTWEPRVRAAAQMLLRGFDAATVLDVGANIGLFSVPTASMIGATGGRLYAFEAQRVVFQQLCANIFTNRLDCVWAFNQAVGAEPGQVEIPTFDYAKASNVGAFSLVEGLQELRGLDDCADRSRMEKIELIALDGLEVEGRVRLVKIDVEGMEIDVVRGGHDFLKRHSFPPIIFEVWEDEVFADGRRALFEEITSLGYAIIRLGRDSFIAQHPNYEAQIDVRIDGMRVHFARTK